MAYETEEDRRKAKACVERFAACIGLSLQQLDQFAPLDYLGRCLATRRDFWIEVKCRNNTHTAFKTTIIDVAKWNKAVELAKATNGEFCFLVNFTDGDYVYRYEPEHVASGIVFPRMGGRTRDTRDANDIQLVMHVPVKLFRHIPAVEAVK